jgi:MFS family permease
VNLERQRLLFLNVGHSFDHLLMLLFPTIVLGLEDEFNRPYGELISLSIPGFVAFAAGTLPAGWLGDRWSRSGMMAIFFIGIGIATILTGFAQNTWQIAAGLGLIGIFASIYHPIGYSILVEGKDKVGRLLGVNGVFGNFGVAGAALVAAVLMDLVSWRVAFIVPGAAAFLVGIIYIWHICKYPYEPRQKFQEIDIEPENKEVRRRIIIRILLLMTFCVVLSGVIYQGILIALPKIFDIGLGELTKTDMDTGILVSAVIALAAFAQIGIGWLVDRYSPKLIWAILVIAQLPFMALMSFVSEAGMLAVSLAMMVLIIGEVPVQDVLITRYTVDAWRSRVFGIKFLLALAPASLAPILVAFLHGSDGSFLWLYIVLGASALAIAIFVVLLPDPKTLSNPSHVVRNV